MVIETPVKVRFCTSCQADREEDTGEIKVKGKIKRWVCRACLDRKTVSIYKNFNKEKTMDLHEMEAERRTMRGKWIEAKP